MIALALGFARDGATSASALPARLSIAVQLDAGVPADVGTMPDGTDLQRHDINTRRFREALSNDGTGGVFYYRPWQGAPENAGKWVIQLKGGGGCQTAALCAQRWKSVGTPFGVDQMSTSTAPPNGIFGNGILYRGPYFSNPFADWNHVFVWYSSSDLWTGTAKDVLVRTTYPNVPGDPRAGSPVAFTINFLGRRILEAKIETLEDRAVPGPRLVYDLGGVDIDMPDLDMATEVVLAGGSAGGYGVINNLDWFSDLLTQRNRSCGRSNCEPTIWGIADSALGPSYDSLDFTSSTIACLGIPGPCTYRNYIQNDATRGGIKLWNPALDRSCVGWHRANAPSSVWQCGDYFTHAIEHVTTPIFLRMGHEDPVISKMYFDLELSRPGAGLLDLQGFAELVRERLTSIGTDPAPLDESPSMIMRPGVFSPTCPNHETLSSNPVVYGATITKSGVSYTLFDVIQAWRAGTGVANVVTLPGDTEYCP